MMTLEKKNNIKCFGMKISRIISLLFILLFIANCSDENGPIGTGEGPQNHDPVSIDATAVKGPFQAGSAVTITRLDELGRPTADVMTTETIDNLGNFNITIHQNELYEISVTGYYFNEISASISMVPLTLRAIYFKTPDDDAPIHVNVLTDIISDRILYLIEQGTSVSSAFSQAQSELLSFLQSALYVVGSNSLDFVHLDIFNQAGSDEIGNAILLYFSLTMYYAAFCCDNNGALAGDSGQLFALLDAIASDLQQNGKVDEGFTIALQNASSLIDPALVTKNLTDYAKNNAATDFLIPDLNKVLDIDQDGLLNDVDPDDDGDGTLDAQDKFPYRFDWVIENNQQVTAKANIDTTIALNFTQPELYFFVNITQSAKHGSVSIDFNSNVATYTPFNSSYTGPDEFAYSIFVVSYDPMTGVVGTIYHESPSTTVLIDVVP